MTAVWAVGLMTGTVLDGNVDIAMLRTDGETIAEFGPYALVAYGRDLRDLLQQTLVQARLWAFEGPEPEIFRDAEAALSRVQAEAVNAFLAAHGVAAGDVSVIGFHGQTVLHRAPAPNREGRTRQLGDGQLMTKITGCDVVYDFRSGDMAKGGQGAPLAPIYHKALLGRIGAGSETAMLNLGGVGNITAVAGEEMIAFDTGPANAPINDWVGRHDAGEMDRDGALARKGRVDEARLERLLKHPYFGKACPKSLDRFDFTADMADGLNLEDGAATLTAFTAAAVGRALDLLPVRPSRLVVSGGGRHNPVLMQEIASRARAETIPAEAVGLRGDALEAECFAFLAVRSLRGLPISFPGTTGVRQPMTGGVLALANG